MKVICPECGNTVEVSDIMVEIESHNWWANGKCINDGRCVITALACNICNAKIDCLDFAVPVYCDAEVAASPAEIEDLVIEMGRTKIVCFLDS